MARTGRPLKKDGRASKKTLKMRKQWREASARHYKKNRRKILDKAKKRGN